jgi:iron complex outermembrane receptor protein
VGVYFADVIGPRANGGTLGGNGAGVGQYFDLQNVQVLKGPQGTLFGRNTTGGAVLIVPQRPKDEFGGYVEGSYGNYDMYRLQGVLNAPLSDTFKVRLGFERQKRDGYVHNRSGIGPSRYNDVDYWAVRGSILADLTPNLENYLIARYSHSSTNGEAGKIIGANAPGCDAGVDRSRYPFPGSPNLTTPGAAPATSASFLAPLACAGTLARARALNYGFWDTEASTPDPFLKIDQWGVINTTTWSASDTITIKNIASYQQFRQRQSFNIGNDNYFVPATNPNPAFRGLSFPWVSVYPAPGLANVEQSTVTEELQLQGRSGDGKLNYVVGGYYEHADPLSPYQGTYSPISYVTTLTAPNVPLPAGFGLPVQVSLVCSDVATLQCRPVDSLGSGQFPGLLQNSLTSYRYRNIGFFGQGTYKLTEQLSVTGGLRYTMDKTMATGATRQLFFFAPNQYNAVCASNGSPAPIAGVCNRSSTQSSKKPTWLIDVDFKPTEDILIYAKYSRGYRQGNINASNTVPQAWGPEKVDAYELGAKATIRGPLSGFINFAAFYNDFSDQQLSASLIPLPGSTASPAQAIVNAGKSRIQGAEIEGQFNYSVFSLGAGYTYLDTKVKSFTPLQFPGYLPATPGVDVGDPLPLTPKHKVQITPSLRIPVNDAIGQITLSATYVYTSSQISFARSQSPYGRVPAYGLWNANASWQSVGGMPVDLSAFVTNLTNKKYYGFSGSGWTSTGVDYAILGQPRMYGVRLRYSFGGEAR